MYLNQYSVKIHPGVETTDGYVEMSHGTQYTLHLRNNHNTACDAQVLVDGKDVGTFRISALSVIELERPSNDQGRFTFYRANSSEAQQADVQNIANVERGLIKVIFTPEKIKPVVYQPYPGETNWQPTSQPLMRGYGNTGTTMYQANATNTMSFASAACYTSVAGVTGLSGHSNQNFYTVAPLDYDYTRQVVIHLRLVCKQIATNTPRPLVSTSNPIPPPLK